MYDNLEEIIKLINLINHSLSELNEQIFCLHEILDEIKPITDEKIQRADFYISDRVDIPDIHRTGMIAKPL